MTVHTVDVVGEELRPDPEGGLGALRTERGNLPLELVEVRAAVSGLAVRTELAQGFRNPFDVPLEATYVFPLPDRAAVTRLRMETADRVVEGIVKEREQARADYDLAIAEGRRASIAEEERPGVFTLRVGNIMPGERVVVRTTLSGRLPYEDGQATFRFPLVVAPRYIPGAALAGGQVGDGTAADTDRVPDASRITPPVLLPGFPNPVRLSIEVAVDPAGLPLNGLTSSLHGVTVTEEGDPDGRRLVRLDPGARCNRDFVLRLAYGGAAAATSLLVARDAESEGENKGADGTFLLTVLPPEPTGATRPRDVALVLDRSGSMDGWKMTAARRAAARIVDTLTAADRFAVLTFDHEVGTPPDLPSDALSAATDRHRFRAVEHLAAAEARGGTEMAEPLRRAAQLLAGDAPERDRVLILVTDGQVGDEDAILSDLSASVADLRIHTVGIDTAVNAGFLNRLAALGGGHCELVESEDRLDEAMDAIHHRIGTPLVTGIRLTGEDGLALDQGSITPARLPDLFVGAPLVVAGRFGGADGADGGDGVALDKLDAAITVTGTAADGSSWTRRVPAVAAADADLAQFWARGRIRDLEDRYAATPWDGPLPLEQEIVATSVRFNVLSRFTAFVAVDTQVVNESRVVKQVMQPVDLPEEWGLDSRLPAPAGMPSPAMFAAPDTIIEASIAAAPMPLDVDVRSSRSVRARKSGGFGHAAATGSALPPPAVPKPAPRPAAPHTAGPMPQAPAAPGSPVPPPNVGSGEQHRPIPHPEPTPPQAMTADELDAFAKTWLARLAAADTTEAQETVLAELLTALQQISSRIPVYTSASLLVALTAPDKETAARLESTTAFLKTLLKPQRRGPFWKR